MMLQLSEGMYQYDIADADFKSRVHLRVDPDLSGLMVVNASRVVHLNPTALYMAFLILEKVDEKTALQAHPNALCWKLPWFGTTTTGAPALTA